LLFLVSDPRQKCWGLSRQLQKDYDLLYQEGFSLFFLSWLFLKTVTNKLIMQEPKKGKITEPLPWGAFFDSDYLASRVVTEDTTVTIEEMRYEEVVGDKGRKDSCLVAAFVEDVKPMVVNATNSKTIQALYKTAIVTEWVGKKITIYTDPTIKSKSGEVVGGLRIRPIVPKTTKDPISPERFSKMLEAIKAGQFTVTQAAQSYALTAEQVQAIKALPK
jgi:hypothetical protein